jgi:multidrug efflux pump
MMGGIVGRLFREFAVTLSVAIAMSLAVSLTTTPMLCSWLLKHERAEEHGRLYRASEKFFDLVLKTYETSLAVVLRHPAFTLCVLLLTIAVNIYLLVIVPKGFFPQQDNGTIFGGIQGAQDISYQAMDSLTRRFVNLIKTDPAVQNAMAFTGGNGAVNSGFVYIGLKPLEQRHLNASAVIDRLRPKLTSLPGCNRFPASRTGLAYWWKAEQCAVPIHPPERQRGGTGEVGAGSLAADAQTALAHRRQYGSAEQRS